MQQFPADGIDALRLQVHNAMLVLALVLGFLNDSVLNTKTGYCRLSTLSQRHVRQLSNLECSLSAGTCA